MKKLNVDASSVMERADEILTPRTQAGQDIYTVAAEGDAVRLKELLKAGKGSVDHTQGGKSALYTACWAGHEECVQLLVDAKANVDFTVTQDFTPLMTAASQGYVAA